MAVVRHLKGTFVRSKGRTRKVKNLGWLLSHWKSVESFRLSRGHGVAANGHLVALMRDGTTYSTDWASFELMLRWLMRPVFLTAPVEIAFEPDYEANEYHTTIGSPKYKRLLDEEEKAMIAASRSRG